MIIEPMVWKVLNMLWEILEMMFMEIISVIHITSCHSYVVMSVDGKYWL